MLQNLQKARLLESIFNKLKLATLFKKRLWGTFFLVNFLKLLMTTFL